MNHSYRVSWEIDIESDTPENAAREALEIMQDAESTATVFRVARLPLLGPLTDGFWTVDLSQGKGE